MGFFKGLRRDPEAVRQRRPGFHLLKAKRGLGSIVLPPSTNNRALLDPARGGPGVLDQGPTNSCVGHAHASGITLRYAIEGRPIPLVSPIGIYTVARMISRAPRADGTLPLLSDDGTEPGLAILGMSEWGVASAATWGNYPASPSTINNEPSIQELEAAGEFKLDGAYFMQETGDLLCRDLMTAMAAGYPVTSAIAASSGAFEGYQGGVLGALDDDIDHATLWLDYERWNGSDLSKVVFWGVNSWNVTWGQAGLYEFSRDFGVKYGGDACVLQISSAGSEV